MREWIVSSAALILAVIALRRLLRGRISCALRYALWLVVAARLLLPVSIGESRLSVENAADAVRTELVAVREERAAQSTLPNDNEQAAQPVTPVLPTDPAGDTAVDAPAEPVPSIDWAAVLKTLWLFGAAAVGLTFAAVNIRFGRRLRRSRRRVEAEAALPVYISAAAETPCLFGLLRPAIYLTPEVWDDAEARRCALTHEQAHYRHGDHLWAAVRGLCLALHWYDPLCWWAAELSRRDGELACDESTVRALGESERAAYGRTLIRLTCEKRPALLVTATTMTDNGKNLRERVTLLVKQPKTAAAAAVALTAALAVVAVATFTGGKAELEEPFGGRSYRAAETVFSAPEFDADFTAETMPTLRADDGGFTLTDAWGGEYAYTAPEELALTAESFDALFTSASGWSGGQSAAKLRRGSAAAWRVTAIDPADGMTNLLYFLQQKDGTCYLALGYDAEELHFFRWVLRLEPVDGMTGEGDAASAAYPPTGEECAAILADYDWGWTVATEGIYADFANSVRAELSDGAVNAIELVPLVLNGGEDGVAFLNMYADTSLPLGDGGCESKLELNMTLQPRAKTEETLAAFMERDAPLACRLAGRLMGAPALAEELIALLERATAEVKYTGAATLQLFANEDSTHGSILCRWEETAQRWVFSSVTILRTADVWSSPYSSRDSAADYGDQASTRSTVEELRGAQAGSSLLVLGRLCYLSPMDEGIYDDLARGRRVYGTGYEAVLRDDSGDLSVRILPGTLGTAELEQRQLLHLVHCRVENGKTVYTVQRSFPASQAEGIAPAMSAEEQAEYRRFHAALTLAAEGGAESLRFAGREGTTYPVAASGNTVSLDEYFYTSAAARERDGDTLLLDLADGAGSCLAFYRGTNVVGYYTAGHDPVFYEAQDSSGAAAGGTLYDKLCLWYDGAQCATLQAAVTATAIPDQGQSWFAAAQAFVDTYEGVQLTTRSGGAYRYTWLSCRVEADELTTESFRTQGRIDENTWCFDATVRFVPESDGALSWAMAGNTVPCADADAPEGAYQYSRCCTVRKDADGWHGQVWGTGW